MPLTVIVTALSAIGIITFAYTMELNKLQHQIELRDVEVQTLKEVMTQTPKTNVNVTQNNNSGLLYKQGSQEGKK